MLSKNYNIAFILITWMVGLTLYAVNTVDPSVQIPVHYGLDGTADRYANVGYALGMMIGVGVFVSLIIHFLPSIDPRNKNVEDTRPAIRGMINATVMFVAIIHGSMAAKAFGYDIDVQRTVMGALGLMFMVMGNYISKTRSNFFVGIRTPWTLSSETVWVKTHRFAGRLLMPVGFIVMVLSIAGLQMKLYVWLIGGIIISTLVPVVYSWIIYRVEKSAD